MAVVGLKAHCLQTNTHIHSHTDKQQRALVMTSRNDDVIQALSEAV